MASEIVSKVMKANKGKNTKLELSFRKALRSMGASGYRLHAKDLPGKPDVVFRSKKVAVFVNGCFWHGCPKCGAKVPKTNSEFWRDKFERNKRNDVLHIRQLESMGWKVITVRECEFKRDPLGSAANVAYFLR